MLGWNAAAVIAHRAQDFILRLPDRNRDHRAFNAVPDGVVQQVIEHLRQPVSVPQGADSGWILASTQFYIAAGSQRQMFAARFASSPRSSALSSSFTPPHRRVSGSRSLTGGSNAQPPSAKKQRPGRRLSNAHLPASDRTLITVMACAISVKSAMKALAAPPVAVAVIVLKAVQAVQLVDLTFDRALVQSC
jgi:hypothetical protein